jgi:hypothetical protein
MLDKILQNWAAKSISQEQQIVDEMARKTRIKDSEKEQEDYFNLLLQEKIAEEKNLLLIRKKAKKNDETPILLISLNNIIQNPVETNQIKLGKDKKNRCSRCGNIVSSEESIEVNLEKQSTYVCSKCMNKEIADFLTYNYL